MVVSVGPRDDLSDLFEMDGARAGQLVAALLDAPEDVLVVLEPPHEPGDETFFVGMQVYEFTHFLHKGLGYSTNLYSSTFYTLTGFHGSHVTLGVIWLSTVLILAIRGKLPSAKSLNLEIAALYWHFVDVVWIVIFPVVYLMR